MDNVLNIAIKGHLTNSNCFTQFLFHYWTTWCLSPCPRGHPGTACDTNEDGEGEIQTRKLVAETQYLRLLSLRRSQDLIDAQGRSAQGL